MRRLKVPANLTDTKIFGFSGIKSNIDPIEDRNSFVRATNLESHVKPGILTLRPTYQLNYPFPVDSLNRISAGKFISFDNYYDKTFGVEVTVLIQSAQIVSTIVGYNFNSVNVWIRPYYNGVMWIDAWQWLNECYITQLATAPDATYLNKMDIQGYIGDLTQWTVINVTKDSTIPAAVLLSAQNGTNTTIYTSNYLNNWAINDVIVLMRNYIPLKYLPVMNAVDQREISFNRQPSKMRIGFGGKEGRVALGVEYVNRTLQLSNYSFTNIAPALVGKESSYANINKVIVQPYIQFNENNRDFLVTLNNVGSGSYAPGTYYFRVTAVLDGFNEVLVSQKSIICGTDNNKFQILIEVLAGSLSRRLSDINVYSSSDGLSYYFWKTLNFSQIGNSLSQSIILENSGYLYINEAAQNMYTESSAVSPSDANSLGSWFAALDPFGHATVLSVVAGTSPDVYAIDAIPSHAFLAISMSLPLTAILAPQIVMNVQYKFEANVFATKLSNFFFSLDVVYPDNTKTTIKDGFTIPILTTDAAYSDLITFTQQDIDNLNSYLAQAGTYAVISVTVFPQSGSYANTDYMQLGKFQLQQVLLPSLDTTTLQGSLDTAQMGYIPTMNLVKDWAHALVLSGRTYAAAGYVDQSYDSLVFFSPIAGSGASEYDVLPETNFLDSDQDSFRGESIIAISILLNLQLIVFTEGGAVVIDPNSGETTEVARGFGIMAKDSLQKIRDTLIWGSTEDICKIAASTGYEATIVSADSIRDIYNSMADKTYLVSCIDRFGTYRMILQPVDSAQELLLTEKGWLDQDREHHPVVIRNGFLGNVWFMDSIGNIYSIPQNIQEQIGYGDLYSSSYKEW
jgi:hypothetical protein